LELASRVRVRVEGMTRVECRLAEVDVVATYSNVSQLLVSYFISVTTTTLENKENLRKITQKGTYPT